jgi:hypothetical protein
MSTHVLSCPPLTHDKGPRTNVVSYGLGTCRTALVLVLSHHLNHFGARLSQMAFLDKLKLKDSFDVTVSMCRVTRDYSLF